MLGDITSLTWLQSFLIFLGRVCISLTFLFFLVYSLIVWEESMRMIEDHNIPCPYVYFLSSSLFCGLGGIMVLIGWRTRLGAFLLLIALSVHVYYFYNFWTIDDQSQMHHYQLIYFMNLAIFGGLLYVLACGPGLLSCDHRRRP
ncbi:MAG: DoxX family protein [Chlamydiales bacterium]